MKRRSSARCMQDGKVAHVEPVKIESLAKEKSQRFRYVRDWARKVNENERFSQLSYILLSYSKIYDV